MRETYFWSFTSRRLLFLFARWSASASSRRRFAETRSLSRCWLRPVFFLETPLAFWRVQIEGSDRMPISLQPLPKNMNDRNSLGNASPHNVFFSQMFVNSSSMLALASNTMPSGRWKSMINVRFRTCVINNFKALWLIMYKSHIRSKLTHSQSLPDGWSPSGPRQLSHRRLYSLQHSERTCENNDWATRRNEINKNKQELNWWAPFGSWKFIHTSLHRFAHSMHFLAIDRLYSRQRREFKITIYGGSGILGHKRSD